MTNASMLTTTRAVIARARVVVSCIISLNQFPMVCRMIRLLLILLVPLDGFNFFLHHVTLMPKKVVAVRKAGIGYFTHSTWTLLRFST